MKFIIFTLSLSLFSIIGISPNSNYSLGIEAAYADTKAQRKKAHRNCRRKYGKRLIRSVVTSNHKVKCIVRKRGQRRRINSFEEATEYCNKTYAGWASIFAKKRRGKWVCFIRQ